MLSFVLAAVAVALHAPEMARHAPLMARSQRAAVRMNEPTEPTEPFDPTNPKQRAQIDAIKEQMKAAVLRGRAAGRTDEQILEDSELLQKLASDLGLDEDAQTSPEPLPSSGEEEWGGWEQTDELISIMLAVDSSARAKDVACKLEDGVSLQVALRGQKLLGGTLAQEVLADELFWCFEEERDGGAHWPQLTPDEPPTPFPTPHNAPPQCHFAPFLLQASTSCLKCQNEGGSRDGLKRRFSLTSVWAPRSVSLARQDSSQASEACQWAKPSTLMRTHVSRGWDRLSKGNRPHQCHKSSLQLTSSQAIWAI